LVVGLAVRVVERGDDQVLQHRDVVFRHHLGVDPDRLHLLRAVDDDRHHAAAGVPLDAEVGHLLLQALLHLLRLLHHLLDVHISATSRTAGGKSASTACPPAWAGPLSRGALFLSACLAAGAAFWGGGPAAPAASASTPFTAIRRPAACWAI